jgi:glycine oxidase
MLDDVIVIGGGAIGCGAALSLAKRGARVRVLERTRPGAEASSAAAGILGAYAEAQHTGPLVELCIASLARYGAWAAALTEATGIDTGYRPCGSMKLFLDLAAFEAASAASLAAFGVAVRVLDGAEARAAEPSLGAAVAGALSFPDDCRVDPPELLRALEASARGAGVAFQAPATVARLVVSGDRATGVALEGGEVLSAGAVVLAAGAWSLLEGSGLSPGEIEPIRGQMIELWSGARRFDRVFFGPGAYLSPRDDGRVVVGSTQEHAGFRKAVTVRGVRGLLEGAVALVPELEDAEITRTWSGLRPSTPDGAPLLGPGAVRGLVVAAGHFRNGILLAPITAEIVASLVLGEAPPAAIGPFAVNRFARSARPEGPA